MECACRLQRSLSSSGSILAFRERCARRRAATTRKGRFEPRWLVSVRGGGGGSRAAARPSGATVVRGPVRVASRPGRVVDVAWHASPRGNARGGGTSPFSLSSRLCFAVCTAWPWRLGFALSLVRALFLFALPRAAAVRVPASHLGVARITLSCTEKRKKRQALMVKPSCCEMGN